MSRYNARFVVLYGALIAGLYKLVLSLLAGIGADLFGADAINHAAMNVVLGMGLGQGGVPLGAWTFLACLFYGVAWFMVIFIPGFMLFVWLAPRQAPYWFVLNRAWRRLISGGKEG